MSRTQWKNETSVKRLVQVFRIWIAKQTSHNNISGVFCLFDLKIYVSWFSYYVILYVSFFISVFRCEKTLEKVFSDSKMLDELWSYFRKHSKNSSDRNLGHWARNLRHMFFTLLGKKVRKTQTALHFVSFCF